MKCGRCTATLCQRHALAEGARCEKCESDWALEAPTRRAAKLIFAPPAAIFAGGLLFVLLLPVTVGGAIGAALMCVLACGLAVSTGAAACKLVDHTARAMFLRERAGNLPTMRLLPSPRR